MSHSYSRDKLEESRRRKRAQQAAQQQRASLPSTNSWRGVTPSQVAKPAQQTAPKTTAPKQNKTAPKTSMQTPQQNIQSAIRSGASHRGITPAQVTRNVSQPVVSLPVIHAAQERAQQVAQNDNTRRARAARAREGQRQAAQANAAALKKDRAALAANSLKWHQTSDAAVRQRLEAENSAIIPHVSLANWWFQPLTQPSNRILLPNQQASFSNAGAKILHFFCSTKFFCNFFQEICIFS